MSSVGAMFAPHHQAVADELIRVCRPDGTIGMINWTPDGFIGTMFATIKPYAPPRSPGPTAPPMWVGEAHVRKPFGDRVTDLQMQRQVVVIDHSATPLDFREYWKRNYGPTIAAYRYNSERPDRAFELDTRFLAFLEPSNQSQVFGRTAYPAEYLLIAAVKR